MKEFYGKYRGKVLENIDPEFLGRIIAEVPAVSGSTTNWAMPCVPYAGEGVGFYAIPPIGANVWIEFEAGDPNYPIWTGCFWSEEQVPFVPDFPKPETKVFKTEFVTLMLDDTPGEGGFTLECIPPAVDVPIALKFDSAGIRITCPEASFSMTPESIGLAVSESAVSIVDGEVVISVPPTVQTITDESVKIESPDISLVAEGTVKIADGQSD